MGRKLSGYIRGSLRMMARQKEHYRRHPEEREQRRALLRALLALPPEGVQILEQNRRPTAESVAFAAARAGVPVEVVEQACEWFLFFFRPGLGLRPAPKATNDAKSER